MDKDRTIRVVLAKTGEAGVDQLVLSLFSTEFDEVLRELDSLAALIERATA